MPAAAVNPPPSSTNSNSDNDEEAAKPSFFGGARPQPLIAACDGPPVPVVEVISGNRRALLHVDLLNDPTRAAIGGGNSKNRSPLCVICVESGQWMTPNQFQRSSGRGTARDWKRSMKHNGYSLKSLQRKNILSLDVPPYGCRCCYCLKVRSHGFVSSLVALIISIIIEIKYY